MGCVRPPPTGQPPIGDITDEDDVAELVRRFYQAALPDPVLGHLFRVGGIEWDTHIPLITAFWARDCSASRATPPTWRRRTCR